MRPPLIMTGPPGAGKSTTGRRLAQRRPYAAFIDVDDVRQLVISGHAAPWEGDEGARQQLLGVENACLLARRFLASGIEVVIADLLDERTATIYRNELPGVLLVHFTISLEAALRRASQGALCLTEAEFGSLHGRDSNHHAAADHDVAVEHLTTDEQAAAVEELWATANGQPHPYR